MLAPLAAIIGGLVMLTWSADRFVTGAAATARALGMSLLLIGLTIVSFGTSAPEILVSAIAAATGAGGLAVGNALGSNIANVGLVLGFTALIAPVIVPPALFRREFVLLLLASGLAGVVLFNLRLTFLDAVSLLAFLVLVLWLFVSQGRKSPESAEIEHEVADEVPQMPLRKAIFLLVTGLLLLLVSSRILVWGGTEMARLLGVSDVVIGLTVVAIGTSLPELAAAVASALKGHHDIAIGTVVGSNLFNLLAVLALPGLFAEIPLEAITFWRDYMVMASLTVLLFIFSWTPPREPRVGRAEGGVLLVAYVVNLVTVYRMTTFG